MSDTQLLENIDCELELCDAEPVNTGDCCGGFNDNGKCVQGKYDADTGECVIKAKSPSNKRIIAAVLIIVGVLIVIAGIYYYKTNITLGTILFVLGLSLMVGSIGWITYKDIKQLSAAISIYVLVILIVGYKYLYPTK